MAEADIKILNDYLDENDRKLVSKKRFKFLQAIENLINENKEQEKMIDLMADSIKHYKTVGDGTLKTRPATREEKIEWFRQKAKELK